MPSLTVSLSPHTSSLDSTQKVMTGVIIAMLPAAAVGVYRFGIDALAKILFSVIACMAVELFFDKFFFKTKSHLKDCSAAVTGILLGFNLPSSLPYWQIFFGALAAVGIAKMCFGGLGRNIFNPALAGRAFLLMAFPTDMTVWPAPLSKSAEAASRTSYAFFSPAADALTAVTPLNAVKGALATKQPLENIADSLPSLTDLFIGNTAGSIGEISALAILIGGIFMLVRKIITWHIPVFYLLGLALFTAVFHLIDPGFYINPLFHILSGGAMLTAWFIATDYATSPMTVKGQIIYALSAGIICGIIRLFGHYPEGASYSILLLNAFVPLIDKKIKPRLFGSA